MRTTASGIGAYFPYELQEHKGDPLYREANFGLCHRDLSPKPAWKVYSEYIRHH